MTLRGSPHLSLAESSSSVNGISVFDCTNSASSTGPSSDGWSKKLFWESPFCDYYNDDKVKNTIFKNMSYFIIIKRQKFWLTFYLSVLVELLGSA